MREIGRVTVNLRGKPIPQLNELEYINGEVFANVWRSDLIVRINPETGDVTGVIDLRKLRSALPAGSNAEVLNGVAYDAKAGRLFVTGKLWPKLFEIKLVEQKLEE